MKLLEQLAPVSEVSHRSGPRDRVVLSSRVRLARNLPHIPFPGHAKRGDRVKAFEQLMPIIQGLAPLSGGLAEPMEKLSALDKQLLVERHLVSREHAAKGVGSGFVLNREESLCVMVNEEDHLRMQALRVGLQLGEAWAAIDAIDTALQQKVELAYSRSDGFLTACPTTLGTGIRVSAMLHLPGLVLAEQVGQIIQAVGKLGLAVRGLYGEGTEALGNLFQVSNQMTLGESEPEIVEKLNKVILQIIEHEDNARKSLLAKKPRWVFNHVGRAYGILCNAHTISSKETLNLLSLLWLGMDAGLIPADARPLVNELFLVTQPAHLQCLFSQQEKMASEERDVLRADVLRDRLAGLVRPDHRRVASPGSEDSGTPPTT
jgi:protein arginine kinase